MDSPTSDIISTIQQWMVNPHYQESGPEWANLIDIYTLKRDQEIHPRTLDQAHMVLHIRNGNHIADIIYDHQPTSSDTAYLDKFLTIVNEFYHKQGRLAAAYDFIARNRGWEPRESAFVLGNRIPLLDTFHNEPSFFQEGFMPINTTLPIPDCGSYETFMDDSSSVPLHKPTAKYETTVPGIAALASSSNFAGVVTYYTTSRTEFHQGPALLPQIASPRHPGPHLNEGYWNDIQGGDGDEMESVLSFEEPGRATCLDPRFSSTDQDNRGPNHSPSHSNSAFAHLNDAPHDFIEPTSLISHDESCDSINRQIPTSSALSSNLLLPDSAVKLAVIIEAAAVWNIKATKKAILREPRTS